MPGSDRPPMRYPNSLKHARHEIRGDDTQMNNEGPPRENAPDVGGFLGSTSGSGVGDVRP